MVFDMIEKFLENQGDVSVVSGVDMSITELLFTR
jgi:hypothetical protein